MTKILYFTHHNLNTYSNDEVVFVRYESDMDTNCYFDAVVCDKDDDSVLQANLSSLPENIMTIVIINNKEDIDSIDSNKYDAWILHSRLDDIYKLLDSQAKRFASSRKVYNDEHLLLQIAADNDINKKSLELIGLNMKKSVNQIKEIFEEQVEEMKKIHIEIKDVRGHLVKDGEEETPKYEDINSAAQKTDELLVRTDDIVKAMFGFVRILQCEDRMSQMIEGIQNIINAENDLIKNNGTFITDEQIRTLQVALVPLFTIDEQREIANGETDLEKLVACRDIIPSSEDALELF